MIMFDNNHKIWFWPKLNWERIIYSGVQASTTTVSISCVRKRRTSHVPVVYSEETIIINLYYTYDDRRTNKSYTAVGSSLYFCVYGPIQLSLPHNIQPSLAILLSNLWRLQCGTQYTHPKENTLENLICLLCLRTNYRRIGASLWKSI